MVDCAVGFQLRYIVPRRYRPDLEDPRPCVTFAPGSYVRLEPAVSGRVDRAQLRWSISPRLPPQTGLLFNRQTGALLQSIQPCRRCTATVHSEVTCSCTSFAPVYRRPCGSVLFRLFAFCPKPVAGVIEGIIASKDSGDTTHMLHAFSKSQDPSASKSSGTSSLQAMSYYSPWTKSRFRDNSTLSRLLNSRACLPTFRSDLCGERCREWLSRRCKRYYASFANSTQDLRDRLQEPGRVGKSQSHFPSGFSFSSMNNS